MMSVDQARRALRDAEIEAQVTKHAKEIDRWGRCPSWRGHFGPGSFIAGVCIGVLLSLIFIVLHMGAKL